MIPLDPEEIIASGCGESLRRVGLALGSLSLGSFFAFAAWKAAFFFFQALDFILPSGWPTISAPFEGAMFLFLLPGWAFATMTFFGAIPNLFVAIIYFARTEEPTARRFLIHAAIHQSATAITIALWQGGGATNRLELTVLITVFVTFQLVALALLIFLVQTVKHRFRVDHEVHLMTVAAQNEARKRELANKVHIPPPPTGTAAPKARKLKETRLKTSPKKQTPPDSGEGDRLN